MCIRRQVALIQMPFSLDGIYVLMAVAGKKAEWFVIGSCSLWLGYIQATLITLWTNSIPKTLDQLEVLKTHVMCKSI